MPTVSEFSTSTYTFVDSDSVSFDIGTPTGEQALVSVFGGSSIGPLIHQEIVTTSRVIGPFAAGDVMTVYAQRGTIGYTIIPDGGDLYPNPAAAFTESEVSALQSVAAGDWNGDVVIAVGLHGITNSGDQSDAIQAAVDDAGARRCRVVFCGTFQISKPIYMKAAYPGARWASSRKHAWYAGDLVQTTSGLPVIVIQTNFVQLDGLTLGYSSVQASGTLSDRVAALTAGVSVEGFGGVYGASFSGLGFYNCDRCIGHSLISSSGASKFPWWGNSYRDIWVHESCKGSALAFGSNAGQVNNVIHGYFYVRGDAMTEPPIKIANGSLAIDGLEINNIKDQSLVVGNNAEINIGYIRFEAPNLDLTGGSNYTAGGVGLLDFAGTRCNIGYFEIQSLRLAHSSGVVSLIRTNGNGEGSVYCRIIEMAGVTRTGSQFLMLTDVNSSNSSEVYYNIGDLVTRNGSGPVPGGWFGLRDATARASTDYLALGYLDRLKAKTISITSGQTTQAVATLDALTVILSGTINVDLTLTAPGSPTINQRRTIVRTVAGAGNVDVFGVATLAAGATGSVTVQHTGSGWTKVQ